MKYNNPIRKGLALLVGAALTGALSISHSAAEDEPILGHRTYGNGPEHVLVLHDWMGNSHNYDSAILHLDGGTFTYVFADVRGYGESRELRGEYTAQEVADDAFRLADSLSWDRFHLVGHSMTGMVVQRMAIDDWVSGIRRLKDVVATTPVPASGAPLDEGLTEFLTAVVHNAELTAQYAAVVTGGHATPAFVQAMANRQINENNADAMHAYRTMWTQTDFSDEAAAAQVGTPMRVIGGRLDSEGFSENVFNQTFGVWYPNVEFRYVEDVGHYIPTEAPVFFAFLVEEFLRLHSD